MTILKTITTALSVNNWVFQNNVIYDAFLNNLTHIHVPFVFINQGQIFGFWVKSQMLISSKQCLIIPNNNKKQSLEALIQFFFFEF